MNRIPMNHDPNAMPQQAKMPKPVLHRKSESTSQKYRKQGSKQPCQVSKRHMSSFRAYQGSSPWSKNMSMSSSPPHFASPSRSLSSFLVIEASPEALDFPWLSSSSWFVKLSNICATS